jgi:flavodoxin
MKTLVVYYSFDGNTRMMAQAIANASGADLLELKPSQEPAAKGFSRYFWAGKSAIMKRRPALLPLDLDPASYELIFLGTPVWAWNCAPPLNTFLAEHDLATKKVALFCCHGGGPGKIFEKMKASLGSAQILGEIEFHDPLKHNPEECAQRARQWAKKIVVGIQPGTAS